MVRQYIQEIIVNIWFVHNLMVWCEKGMVLDVKNKEVTLPSLSQGKSKIQGLQHLAHHIGYLLAGLLMSRGTIFGEFSPFGVAMAACAPKAYSLSALVGAAAGYLIPSAGRIPLRYLAAVLVVAGLRWALDGFPKIVRHMGFPALSVFGAVFATGLAVLYVDYLDLAGAAMVLAEAVLAGGCTLFLTKTVELLSDIRKMRGLSQQELASVVISTGILLISLTSVQIQFLSPGRMIAVLIVLFCAQYGKSSAGAISGISMGAVMSLATSGQMYYTAAYAFGGLMAGVFAPAGNLAVAAAFVISNGLTAILAHDTSVVLPTLYEAMASTLIFMVLSFSPLSQKIRPLLRPQAKTQGMADGLRENVVMRLDFASKALSDVSEAVEAVNEKLLNMTAPSIGGVFLEATDDVCKSCSIRSYCWEKNQSHLLNAFNDMTPALREKGKLIPDDAPEYFSSRCSHTEDMLHSVNRHYGDYMLRESVERRVNQIRQVVSDQFEGLSEMLGDLSLEFSEAQSYDTAAAQKIMTVLGTMGFSALEATCRVDKFQRMTVEILCEKPIQPFKHRDLSDALSDTCQRSFDLPCMSDAGESVKITLTEHACLGVQIGAAQHAFGKNALCGDAFEYFMDGQGRCVVMLSDGMGNGGRAAVDGAMASGLLAKLIKAGFGFDCSLRVVNSALLAKTGEESLATLDVCCVDLFTGKADFYKAGAAQTLVRKGKKFVKIDCGSLPAGILREVSFEKFQLGLEPGDVLVVMSDGALHSGVEWMEAELETYGDLPAQELADRLLEGAEKRRPQGFDDDITILTAVVEKGI